ncbi:DUF4417 domain-containing protein [Mucilaginibacter sp. UR6-1]|uniref:DUF4417 domain-containing protein n=1 Tax=Mucilaginibacter sp. UR6-1 TaxID=1435643 RepID=UPI001E5D8DDF|nr:DUF4417 domain-containing protein [Mucilaginibacter sp. UR6-1]MCC8410489.1 DUF4417 domain-containing protein [Mucilaginibacter sp. UR6-1]
MLDLQELHSQPSLFSYTCEVFSGTFSPYIDSNEAFFVSNTCVNEFRRNIITCKDKYRHEFVDEVEGLALNVNLHTQCDILPSYIPVYNKMASQLPNLSGEFPVIALTLKDILSSAVSHKAGGLQEDKSIIFRNLLLNYYCFRNAKVLLFSSGPDTLIEYLWHQRELCTLYEKIRKMDFYAMTGFNFSLITGECAFAQSLNIKRSLYSSYEIEQSGISTIPHVYALTDYQIQRWLDWFKSNPHVSYFTINCQLQASKKEFLQVVKTVTKILETVPHTRVILQGFSFTYLYYFGVYIDRVHVAESLPVKKAQSYQRIFLNPDTHKMAFKYDRTLTVAELVTTNIRERYLYWEYLKNRILLDSSLMKGVTA